MIDWVEITDSCRITAAAYDDEEERILVRFPDGPEWQYEECPPFIWEEFMDTPSKGRFIHERLNYHPHGPLQE